MNFTFKLLSFFILGVIFSTNLLFAQEKNLVQEASTNDNLTTLVNAIEKADLAGFLSGEQSYTIFAPSEKAFAALPKGTLDDLLKPENQESLIEILQYHIIPGKVSSTDLSDGKKIKTLHGSVITVDVIASNIIIDGAEISDPNLPASNGVIHIIDSLILPDQL